MVQVTGIGGFFFRARNPEALAAWYEKHLGIANGATTFWVQGGGPTAFTALEAETDYIPQGKDAMLNLRVDNLAEMLTKLASDGVAIEGRPAWNSEIGSFARIYDPEGNPIELWEPANT